MITQQLPETCDVTDYQCLEFGLIPADSYFGKEKYILGHRKTTKEKTLTPRRKLYKEYCQHDLPYAVYEE